MPQFQYRCSKCQVEFEVIRKFSDDGIEECPNCEHTLYKCDRVVGSTSFKLSGKGWAKDGYK